MPLIVVCGKPLVGKSTVARNLHSYYGKLLSILVSDEKQLREHGPKIIYGDTAREKVLRSWLKSEVQRSLATNSVVIVDAANYIKGYRYELYCLSKQCKTPFVLVECLPPDPTVAIDVIQNQIGDEKGQYSKEIFDELVARYEPPSSRWEDIVFKIPYQTDTAEKSLPYDAIDEAVLRSTGRIVPKRSTQTLLVATDKTVIELDQQTQLVINEIQAALKENRLSDIQIPDVDARINLNRMVSMAELNKLRRQFLNYRRLMPGMNQMARTKTEFVHFINQSSQTPE